jgi:5-(carboxyamino)imidazole ribonucleotide synthase
MLNVLGQHMEKAQAFVQENPSAHLHLYGKLEAKHNRKMGHVTVLGEDAEGFGD